MKKITVTKSSFQDLIQEGFIYVDKTKEIYNLITKDDFYFLARPRRFGKSLLISTLKELFEGNRELFKGLWIDSSNYSWEKYPVIALDFSGFSSGSPQECKEKLGLQIDSRARDFGIDLQHAKDPDTKITELIETLGKEKKVVILVDEYDYPILNAINTPEVRDGNLQVLKALFFQGLITRITFL